MTGTTRGITAGAASRACVRACPWPCVLLQILDSLADDMVIPHEKADAAKSRFAKLHATLVAAMTREKELLMEAKSLKRKLDVRGHAGCGLACVHVPRSAWAGGDAGTRHPFTAHAHPPSVAARRRTSGRTRRA